MSDPLSYLVFLFLRSFVVLKVSVRSLLKVLGEGTFSIHFAVLLVICPKIFVSALYCHGPLICR
jgi:hypothetical protein